MSDKPPETFASRFEREADGGAALAKKRPWLAVCIVIILLGWGAWHLFIIHGLEKKLESEKSGRVQAESRAVHAEDQLAPFLAVADKEFSNQPTVKRVDLLLKKVEGLENTVAHVDSNYSALLRYWDAANSQRRFTVEGGANLTNALAKIPKLTLSIVAGLGDRESMQFAQQWAGVLRSLGWNCDMAATVGPENIPPLSLQVHSERGKDFERVLRELNFPIVFRPSAIRQGADDGEITIGPK